MVSTWCRCEGGGEFICASRLVDKTLPYRIHLCILAHDFSGSLLTPRSSPPRGAIRELRCPTRCSSPSLQNKDPGGGVGSTSRGWRLVGLGVGMGGFRDQGVEPGRFRYM